MKNYIKSIGSSYLIYLDANNLYRQTMSEKLPVNGFKWVNDLSRFNQDFIENSSENSDIGYFLEVDVEYPKKLFSSHKDLSFLPERKENRKSRKTCCGTEDKEKYVIHIIALKQTLNHGLILKRVHRVIIFNQEAQIKPYMDMNTKPYIDMNSECQKGFFKLKNNSVFEKTMENVRKHRDIKLATTEEKKINQFQNQIIIQQKYFSKYLLAIKMKKTKVKMNKPVYLGMSILDISKTLMNDFWYDYVKTKYKDKAKLCYMDTDSFVIHIFSEDVLERLTMMLKGGLIHLTVIRMTKGHFKQA